MKLKIAAISDIHGYLPEMIEPADILLLAGDISPIEIQFNKLKMKNWLKTEFAQWIKSLPVEKVFMVAGNHDSYFEGISKANILEMSQACQKLIYLKNETTHFIDKEGQLWSIFGTPYCHIYGNWPFMRSEEYMVEKFKKIPDEVDIIISHDPPFAAGDVDVILDVPVGRLGKVRLHEHLGNQPLKERIENVNYKLLVCGHIHGGEHIFNNEWRTVNVSYLDEAYQPAHSIFYKEIEK